MPRRESVPTIPVHFRMDEDCMQFVMCNVGPSKPFRDLTHGINYCVAKVWEEAEKDMLRKHGRSDLKVPLHR